MRARPGAGRGRGPEPFEEWTREGFVISTSRDRLDHAVIQQHLAQSYWAAGRSLEQVRQSFAGSLPFGIYRGGPMAGFGRVVTDYVTVAYLADVLVLPPFRGQGLGTWLIEAILVHPRLQAVGTWLLRTRDAHQLYARYGFAPLGGSDTWMHRSGPPRDASASGWTVHRE